MLSLDFNPRKVSDHIFHIFLPLLAVVLPLLFLSLDLPIAPLIMTSDQRLFGMFSFCMWCVLVAAVYREFKARPGISLEKAVLILLPLLVSFFLLVLIVEYADVSWDYQQYEDAYRTLVQGKNPYRSEQYLYPPLFAQVMAFIHAAGTKFPGADVLSPWVFVFYIYQCVQFLLGSLAYQLSSRFASRIGFSDLHAKLIVAALFLFNFPLIRTLHLNQVNLLILDTTLVAILALSRFPTLGGAAITLGGLVKLYPFILGAPLLLMKKWKALLGSILGGALIIFFFTNFGRDFTLWRQFVEFMLSFPAERESSIWIRNTSILSLLRNLSRFAGLPEAAVTPLYIAGALAVLAWIFLRLYKRERTYPTLPPGPAREAYRNFGNLIDVVSLSLLVTPSAWDHHFVLALPLALWATALRRKDRPGWVGIATACIFVLPPFDIFPFSYLRMFGVIALLILASPNIQPDLGDGSRDPILT
jgi:hypothetical protein